MVLQYVPEAELTKIVKEVKRERRKKYEEKQWEEYLESRRLNTAIGNPNKKEMNLKASSFNSVHFDGETLHNECTQSNFINRSGLFSNADSGDGKPNEQLLCQMEEEDCLYVNLEKLNKLDKLRIFDCPDIIGPSCSDCLTNANKIHHHPSFNHFCHDYKHSAVNYEESCKLACCNNQKTRKLCPSLFHISSETHSCSENDGTGDGVTYNKQLLNQRLPPDFYRSVVKSHKKCRGSVSCMNLVVGGAAEGGSPDKDKVRYLVGALLFYSFYSL